MTTVYIALGTNVGDREHNLREALRLLAESGIRVMEVSSIYETEPVDYLEQAWFLNAALEAQTDLPPLDLLHKLRAIESAMGSKKPFAKGPRLIDLDILLYGNEIITTPELQIPHPRMLDRRFVLAPLAEIAPNLRHQQWPATATQLLATLKDPSEVRRHPSGHDISRPTGG
jgi:2-amino-4-hydroxy-6-hydroxymethyldihydropteridine diphosphokinase